MKLFVSVVISSFICLIYFLVLNMIFGSKETLFSIRFLIEIISGIFLLFLLNKYIKNGTNRILNIKKD